MILAVHWESTENGNKQDCDPQTLWGNRQRKLRSSECTLLVSGTNKYTATAAHLLANRIVPVFQNLFQHGFNAYEDSLV